jgi:hypothetical protein
VSGAGVGVGEGSGVGDGLGVGVGVGDGEGLGVGVGVGDGDGLGVSNCDGEGLGVGERSDPGACAVGDVRLKILGSGIVSTTTLLGLAERLSVDVTDPTSKGTASWLTYKGFKIELGLASIPGLA